MLRSLLSGVIAACFALSAITWGTMPGCVVATKAPAAHAAQEPGTSDQHSKHSGKLPASAACLVHLCCLQLATPGSVAVAPLRVSAPARATGLVAVTVFFHRPSHTLPFAHAPPHTPA